MNPPKIKNIIFDLGNTLVYYNYCYFYDGVARLEKKLNARTFERYIKNKKLDIKLGKNKISNKKYFKILKKKFNLKIGYSDFKFLYCDIFWENTAMESFIENKILESKYKIFMLSNVDSVHINYVNHNFPITRIFKNRILSYKVGMIKPDKKIFKHFILKNKIKPEETLFIDDMRKNILASKSLGFNTIHYTSHKRFLKEFNKLTK